MSTKGVKRGLREAARALDLQAEELRASTDAEIDLAFETLGRQRIAALMVVAGPTRKACGLGSRPCCADDVPFPRIYPPFLSDALVPLMSNAKVEQVPDSGHSVYFQRAEVFNRLVEDFLSKVG